MALKRQHETLSMFSMASMTDVIFLLLIFFLVTSTFVFPSALEVNLPQSSEQTAIKPNVRVYIDKDSKIYAQQNSESTQGTPSEMSESELKNFMETIKQGDPSQYIALHADEKVPYGKIVEILDMGAQVGIKVVLATKPANGQYSAPDKATETVEQGEFQPTDQDQAYSTPTVNDNSNTTVNTSNGNANAGNTPAPNLPEPVTTVIEQ